MSSQNLESGKSRSIPRFPPVISIFNSALVNTKPNMANSAAIIMESAANHKYTEYLHATRKFTVYTKYLYTVISKYLYTAYHCIGT